jgi:hypothetical protein
MYQVSGIAATDSEWIIHMRPMPSRPARYDAFDAVVDVLSGEYGASPIATCYEAGGHQAYAMWLIPNPTNPTTAILHSAILSTTMEDTARDYCAAERLSIEHTAAPTWPTSDGWDDLTNGYETFLFQDETPAPYRYGMLYAYNTATNEFTVWGLR